jgi:hypothetical protein
MGSLSVWSGLLVAYGGGMTQADRDAVATLRTRELLEAVGQMLLEAGDVMRHRDLGADRDGFESARKALALALVRYRRDVP